MLYFIHKEEPNGIWIIRNMQLVMASTFIAECQRVRKARVSPGYEDTRMIISISLADINKELDKRQAPLNPADTIPAEFLEEFPILFSKEEA